MALDRYFGYSTAWIRYVTAAMASGPGAWARCGAEFQNNLSQLEKDLQTKADEAKAKAKPAAAGAA